MFKLNLGFDNADLYRGCELIPQGGGRYNLATPIDSAVVIVASNLMEMLKAIPEEERDLLVLTGATAPEIVATAASILYPHFKARKFFNGKRKVTTTIPQPPPDFQSEREDEER